MARPTADERRLAYLEVGADLVADFGARAPDGTLDALANVKVSDVARRAGVTKGALYHIWESQEDFRRDLLQHLLDSVEQEGLEAADRTIASAVDAAGHPVVDTTELATLVATRSYCRMRDDPRMLARFSFYNYTHDERVTEMLADGTSAFDTYYARYLSAAGRRMRGPFAVQHLSTAMNAYLFGSIIRYRITAGGPADVDDERLYADGVRALLVHLTEPDDRP